MADTPTEKSAFETAMEAMTSEQFERVSEILRKEAERRDDPFKRIGSMSDSELEALKDKVSK